MNKKREPEIGAKYVTINNDGLLEVKNYNRVKEIITYIQDGYQYNVRLKSFKMKIAKREYQKDK